MDVWFTANVILPLIAWPRANAHCSQYLIILPEPSAILYHNDSCVYAYR